MALTPLTTDLNVIQALDNYPPDDPGMTPALLKAKFDQAPNAIKTYINDVLLPELEAGCIASIERTSGDGSAGTTDTYTITYQDDSTDTFTVYNGADGATGAAGADGTSAYVHIKWGATATPATLLDTPDEYIGICSSASDTPPADYTGYKWYQWKGAKGDTGETGSAGVDGVDGADGRGITSITRTVGDGSPGTTDTYTITYTDETTDEFTVYNGADGAGAGDMLKAVYDEDADGIVDNAEKVNGHTVESDVPSDAVFTDTVTTINGKTGAITKDDIVALGIPAQDTVYEHPTTAGNKHIPPGGSVGQILRNTADGTVGWSNTATDYTATIPATWTGDSAPYTQDVAVTGITSDDAPIIMPVYSDTLATAIAQKEAWNLVSKAITSTNKITFTCFEEKPVTAIPIQIKVVR